MNDRRTVSPFLLLRSKILRGMLLIGIALFPMLLALPPVAEAATGNLLKNANFELGNLNWYGKNPSTAPGIVGAESCCANHTPGGHWNAYLQPEGQLIQLYQDVAVQADSYYHLEAWVSTNGMTSRLFWYSNAGGGTAVQCGMTTAVWPTYQRLSCEFQVPSGTTYFNVSVSGTAPSGKWVVTDDWSLSKQPFYAGNQHNAGYGVKAIINAPSSAPNTPPAAPNSPAPGQYNWVSTAGPEGWVQTGWRYWPYNGDTQARAYTEANVGGHDYGRTPYGTHTWGTGVWYRVQYTGFSTWHAYIADSDKAGWGPLSPTQGLQALSEVRYDDAVQVNTQFSSVQYQASQGGSWTLFDQALWTEVTPYKVNSKSNNYQWTSIGPSP